MRTLLIIFIILTTVSGARAVERSTLEDITLEVIAVALLVVDYGQTLYISDNPNRVNELNPILGEHPSRRRVNIYFGSIIAGHIATAYFLPRPYRTWFQGATIAIELPVASHNASIGIRMRF